MKTTTIPDKTDLDTKAEILITAANEYYDEYQKTFKNGHAVVYLHDNANGNTVVYTRGEYLQDIKSFVESLSV